MKASELRKDGFYWCSHELCVFPISAAEPGWNVVQLIRGHLWACGAEVGIASADVPAFADFVGPILPPD